MRKEPSDARSPEFGHFCSDSAADSASDSAADSASDSAADSASDSASDSAADSASDSAGAGLIACKSCSAQLAVAGAALLGVAAISAPTKRCCAAVGHSKPEFGHFCSI